MSAAQTVSLRERIDADLRDAMRAQDQVTKLTLRAVKTALTEMTKAKDNHEPTDDDAMAVLQREAKRRREAASEYDKVGGHTQAAQERAELAVLERYLPRQLGEAELEAIVRAAIAETGVTSAKEMGRVMPVVMGRVGGQADGKAVSQIVRRLLGA
jgi:uncharacterized protein